MVKQFAIIFEWLVVWCLFLLRQTPPAGYALGILSWHLSIRQTDKHYNWQSMTVLDIFILN